MTTLEELLGQEDELNNAKAQLSLQMQGVDDSLASVRIRITEIRNVNRNTPTYNLPNEILSTIFEAGLLPVLESSFRRPLWAKNRPFELLVSSVSHRWRDVALHTPRLWANLDINILKSTSNLFGLYLHRSQTCLLDITFQQTRSLYVGDIDEDFKVKNFNRHLEWLVPHIVRWRKFVIMGNVNVGSLSKALSSLIPLHAPALETFVISCSSNIRRKADQLFSGGTPRLSSVELYDAYILPPLGSVESLQLGNQIRFTHAEFSRLVLSMSSLRHLSIHDHIVTNPGNQPEIELPSVRSLDIQLIHGVGVLHSLDLPAVKTMIVRSETDAMIKTFTQHHRSYPLVRLLKVISGFCGSTPDMPDATILDFVSLFPNVQDVAFHGADSTPILHVFHDRQPTDALLWPELTAITIIPTSMVRVSYKKQTWAYITKLVANRLSLGHPISRLQLSSNVLERGSNRQQQRLKEQVALVEC